MMMNSAKATAAAGLTEDKAAVVMNDNTNNDDNDNNNDKDDEEEDFSVAVVDYQSPNAAQLLTASLKTTGFAVLTNYTPLTTTTLIHDVYQEWRTFLIHLHHEYQRVQQQQPLRPKSGTQQADDEDDGNQHPDPEDTNLAAQYYFDVLKQDGYFPMAVSETAKGATAKDLKHYYQCYFPHGRYPKCVSDEAQHLWHELLTLGTIIVGWIDEHMPDEIRNTIQTKIGSTTTLQECVSTEHTMMRILHYPGGGNDTAKKNGAVRAAPHEDINLITILPAGSARGLQVQSQTTGKWWEVPLVPNSIVINVGDMLQEMSDGAYKSTTHRVIELHEEEEDANEDENAPDATTPTHDCSPTAATVPPPTPDDASSASAAAFGTKDRMSTPCFIHLHGNCPLSDRYGSADHYLKERLVTLGVVPATVLDDFLVQYPDGKLPGWNR